MKKNSPAKSGATSSPHERHPPDLFTAQRGNADPLEFTWRRRGGDEVSSKGDKRFSALFATLGDGRTIEQHYQCDAKGYDPGGRNWRLGKGKSPLDLDADLSHAYLALWREWARGNPGLIEDLRQLTKGHGGVLSDCFAATAINQAWALATILNEGAPE